MGEYATRKSDNQPVKIGTCNSMYYCRFEDRSTLIKEPHSLDPAYTPNLQWRLPHQDEDHLQPGDYDSAFRGVRLQPFQNPEGQWAEFDAENANDHPGLIQLHHPASGLMVNAKCFHGSKLPEDGGDLQAHWNGKDPYSWELIAVKNHFEDGWEQVLPLIQCRHCREMFRSTWEKVLPHVADEELRLRLALYESTPPVAIRG